jgi:hypothetical protein
MDSVHGAVDHADPVHRGPVAIATSPRSSELSLRLLRWSRLPNEGRRRKREARGPSSGLTRVRKVVERRRVSSEGGGRESSGAGSLEALKQGKEEQWEERMPGRPFIGSEGERGGRVPYPGSRKQNRSIYTCVQDV